MTPVTTLTPTSDRREERGRRPTVAIETHGCKLNQADSMTLALEFQRAGYLLAGPEDPADVYVLNTCTVTHVADRKARQALRAARRRRPDALIVVTGCYAQRDPQALEAMAEVDLVVGNADKASLVRQVAQWRDGLPVPCAVGEEVDAFSPRVARTRAMAKIQEGCDQVCAYCIVPKVRGRERSVPLDRVVAQVRGYVARGYQEVVLTGTQLGSYGFDLPDVDLARLVEAILDKTDVKRLRVSSLQPQDIDRRLLSLWQDPRLCPHFHMPLQSGSDAVLRRMRRRYTAALYEERVALVREMVPAVSITADVIVGFPGETEEDFQATLELCRRVGFAGLHIFPYSPRPGTSAAHFRDQVPPPVKARRAQELAVVAQEGFEGFRRSLLGGVRPVLWEERRQGDNPRPLVWTGLTDNYVRVMASGPEGLANRITPARLLRLEEDLVVAQVLPTRRVAPKDPA